MGTSPAITPHNPKDNIVMADPTYLGKKDVIQPPQAVAVHIYRAVAR